jgi:hypothetical protein
VLRVADLAKPVRNSIHFINSNWMKRILGSLLINIVGTVWWLCVNSLSLCAIFIYNSTLTVHWMIFIRKTFDCDCKCFIHGKSKKKITKKWAHRIFVFVLFLFSIGVLSVMVNGTGLNTHSIGKGYPFLDQDDISDGSLSNYWPTTPK